MLSPKLTPRSVAAQPHTGEYLAGVPRPHPALIDLAARRDPALNELSRPLIESSVEHRVPGILHTWAAKRGLLTGEQGAGLQALDSNVWARNRMLVATAARVDAAARDLGIRTALIKGVALEAMAYSRFGERPSGDLDVVVHHDDRGGVVDLVAALQPEHRLISDLADLVEGRHIQSIDLVVDGLPMDIHLDPLKLEVAATRHPMRLWERTATVTVEGTRINTFDHEASLVLALLHLNKDRFSHLVAYADVVRLWRGVDDWDWVESFAQAEGLVTPLRETAAAVVSDLAISDLQMPLPAAGGERVWKMLWPERIRLSGAVGRVRYRYRQMLIPVFSPDRIPEVARSWIRRMFPPRQVLAIYYPNARGPYAWRIISSRVARRVERRQRRLEATRRDQSRSGVDSSDFRT